MALGEEVLGETPAGSAGNEVIMAVIRVFNRVQITERVVSEPKQWPAIVEKVRFGLDDAEFTDPGQKIRIGMQCSWDGGQTWPYQDLNEWTGGAKARDGASPSVVLGPFLRGPDREIQNPTHVRFMAEPVEGTPTVGLMADVG